MIFIYLSIKIYWTDWVLHLGLRVVLGYFKTSPSTIEPLKGRDTAILDKIVSIQKKLTDLLLMRVVYHSKPIPIDRYRCSINNSALKIFLKYRKIWDIIKWLKMHLFSINNKYWYSQAWEHKFSMVLCVPLGG